MLIIFKNPVTNSCFQEHKSEGSGETPEKIYKINYMKKLTKKEKQAILDWNKKRTDEIDKITKNIDLDKLIKKADKK